MHELVMDDVFLRAFFRAGYGKLIEIVGAQIGASVLEIGAGSSLVKILHPELPVITSDVVYDSALDLVCSATELPFGASSLDGIVAKDALHHLPNVASFFQECVRTLKPGARAVFLEPYWGPLASLVFRYFHQEPFDRDQTAWHFDSGDPWDSNQALPWILLRRDREKLNEFLSSMVIEEHQTLFGVPLLLSGGVFNRSLVPSSVLKNFLRIRKRPSWFSRLFHFYIIFSIKKLP